MSDNGYDDDCDNDHDYEDNDPQEDDEDDGQDPRDECDPTDDNEELGYDEYQDNDPQDDYDPQDDHDPQDDNDPQDDYDPQDDHDQQDDHDPQDDYDRNDDSDPYGDSDQQDPEDYHDAWEGYHETEDNSNLTVDDLDAYLSNLTIGSEHRRYGYYRCPKCSKTWTSAQTFCIYKGSGDKTVGEVTSTGRGIFEPNSRQACSNCKPQQMTAPYRTEKLKVPTVDTSGGDKAHKSDHCERCLQGRSCRFTM